MEMDTTTSLKFVLVWRRQFVWKGESGPIIVCELPVPHSYSDSDWVSDEGERDADSGLVYRIGRGGAITGFCGVEGW